MKLRAGVIGLGVGQAHAEAYLAHPECELAAVCDSDEAKLGIVRQSLPEHVKCRLSADEVLDDPNIDIVSIASYDNFHYEQVKRALTAGKHVFVEKPLCLYESEAREIRRLLNEKPALTLSSNLVLRKAPRFVEAKRLIEQGRLGRLFYAEGDYNYGRLHKILDGWRGRIEGYSPVYGGGVHLVDLLLWLSQERPTEAVAAGGKILTAGSTYRAYDLVVTLLRFESGLLAKIAVNLGCVYPHFHRVSLYGSTATFENAFDGALLFESRDVKDSPSNSSGVEQPRAPLRLDSEYPGTHKGVLLRNFIETVLGRETLEIPVDEMFAAMQVCFAIEKASHGRAPVTVDYF